MSSVSKISSGAVVVPLVRRLPTPAAGVDLNFCRNPGCPDYGVLPDPFRRPKKGSASTSGRATRSRSKRQAQRIYKRPACGTTSRVKNNHAVVEEHERLRRLQATDPFGPACRTEGCANQDFPVDVNPDLYQRFGKTKGGDPRWRCKDCTTTFSIGKPARRHKRSDKNRLVLDTLCNDLSFAKTAKISGFAYRDIYRRIDFYHERMRSFVARREDFSRVDFAEVGSRFATDSQALTVNWPNRKPRFPVVFQGNPPLFGGGPS